jgi:transposase
LSKQEFLALRKLCHLSKNLYNVGLYSVRQFFFTESRYLRYESNYHYCKSNENYRLLNTDIAQQTLKVVDRSFRSFFNLIKTAKQGLYRFEQIRLPGYLPKDGYFPLIMPRIKVKEGYFDIPISNEFRKQFGSVRIPFPERLAGKKLKEVRILPKYKARFFEVEYIVEAEVEPQSVDPNNKLAIDLELDNLATCVSTTGASFIVDGKPLKSFNQWYNKENARLQSIKDLQRIKGTTDRQARLTINRNNRVRDYLNKTAQYIINWCIEQKIGTVIVGAG